MSKQTVTFGAPGNTLDNGDRNADSIQRLSDQEDVSESVLNRPSDVLRTRTEILRAEVENLKYLADADRAILQSCTGLITVSAAGAAMSFSMDATEIMTLRPLLSPGKVSTPAKARIPGSVSGSYVEITATSKLRAYGTSGVPGSAGANEYTVTTNTGSAFAVSVGGVPGRHITITYVAGTTLAALSTALTANATFNNLFTATVVGSSNVTTVSYVPFSGAYDAEVHTLTGSDLASFFNTTANKMQDGDTLAVGYEEVVSTTSGSNGGRRQSIDGPPENNASVGSQIYNLRTNSERIAGSLPICTRAGDSIIFMDGTTIAAGKKGRLGGSGLAENGGTISGNTVVTGNLGVDGTVTADGLVKAPRFESTVPTGNAPLTVASTTKVENLNADKLDGADWADPADIGVNSQKSAKFTMVQASGQVTSTVANGTAPFVVASSTVVQNLNVSKLLNYTWASPDQIGSTEASTGKFTTLEATDVSQLKRTTITAPATGVVPVEVKGLANQTANLQTWGIGDVVSARVEKDGTVRTSQIGSLDSSKALVITDAVTVTPGGGASVTLTLQQVSEAENVSMQKWMSGSGGALSTKAVLTGAGRFVVKTIDVNTDPGNAGPGTSVAKITDEGVLRVKQIDVNTDPGAGGAATSKAKIDVDGNATVQNLTVKGTLNAEGGSAINDKLTLQPDSKDDVPLTLIGKSDQTANLQDWKKSVTDAPVAFVDKDGNLTVNNLTVKGSVGSSTGSGTGTFTDLTVTKQATITASTADVVALTVKANNDSSAKNIQEWLSKPDASSAVAYVDNNGRGTFTGVSVTTANSDLVSLTVKGRSSAQEDAALKVRPFPNSTANLQEWYDVNTGGTAVAKIDKSGNLTAVAGTFTGAVSGTSFSGIIQGSGASTFSESVAFNKTGAAPFTVLSDTAVPNLNASLLLGNTWASPGAIGLAAAATGKFAGLTAVGTATATDVPLKVLPAHDTTANLQEWYSDKDATAVVAAVSKSGQLTAASGQFKGGVAFQNNTGAPFTVTSATKVDNLNAAKLDGATWGAPLDIGTAEAKKGKFTYITIPNSGPSGWYAVEITDTNYVPGGGTETVTRGGVGKNAEIRTGDVDTHDGTSALQIGANHATSVTIGKAASTTTVKNKLKIENETVLPEQVVDIEFSTATPFKLNETTYTTLPLQSSAFVGVYVADVLSDLAQPVTVDPWSTASTNTPSTRTRLVNCSIQHNVSNPLSPSVSGSLITLSPHRVYEFDLYLRLDVTQEHGYAEVFPMLFTDDSEAGLPVHVTYAQVPSMTSEYTPGEWLSRTVRGYLKTTASGTFKILVAVRAKTENSADTYAYCMTSGTLFLRRVD